MRGTLYHRTRDVSAASIMHLHFVSQAPVHFGVCIFLDAIRLFKIEYVMDTKWRFR